MACNTCTTTVELEDRITQLENEVIDLREQKENLLKDANRMITSLNARREQAEAYYRLAAQEMDAISGGHRWVTMVKMLTLMVNEQRGNGVEPDSWIFAEHGEDKELNLKRYYKWEYVSRNRY